MEVQTFSGRNMKETIAQVRKSLGKDAVIISTHEEKDNLQHRVIVKATHVDKRTTKETLPPSLQFEEKSSSKILSTIKNSNEQQNSYIRQMIGTMSDIKTLVAEALKHQTENQDHIPTFLQDVHYKLLRSGLNATLLKNLCDHLATICHERSTEDSILAESVRWMTSRLHIAPPIDVLRGHQDIHLFVGPPGAGKSSIIARLAHHIQTTKNLKVLVLSYEPKRLSGSGSLQVLSRILGFHYTAIRHSSEILSSIEKSKSFDVILIDTSGFLPSSEEDFREFQDIARISQGIETHLVLSMLTRHEVLNDLVLKFSPLGISSLMFSHLDAGCHHADLFNLPVRWSCPLSYGSTGHELPEGLERLTREKVVEFIFGL